MRRAAAALALLALAQPSGAVLDVGACILGRCITWPLFSSDACRACMDGTAGFGQLPFSYTTDMLAFKTTDRGYTEGWCGEEDVATGGWRCADKMEGWYDIDGPKFTCEYYVRNGICEKEGDKWANFGMTANEACCGCGGGAYTGCEETENFPGVGSTSIQSWDQVKAEMAAMVPRFAAGEIWRGNELGFIISNEEFWPEAVNPRSVLLGATPQQHAVLRPYLEAWFTCDAACQEGLVASARRFTSKDAMPEKMEIQADVKKWVFEELFKRVFPHEANPIDADEFVKNQDAVVSLSTITQLLPDDALTRVVAREALATLHTHFTQVEALTRAYYGADLAEADARGECQPSASCVHQLASAVLDTLYFAGGLSVPSAISTGMWVLYADTSKYGATFPRDHRLDRQDPLPFFYESMRFFAPVVGFPWWEKAPARKDNPAGSQYEDGVRRVLNVALANKDPNKWGADAHRFRVRDAADYHAWFIGFAEHAVHPDHPTQTRACPGKTLALAMGAAWFGVLDQYAWGDVMGGKVPSKYEEKVPFVEGFTLQRRTGLVSTGVWKRLLDVIFRKAEEWLPTFDSMDAVDLTGKVYAMIHAHEAEVLWPTPAPDARFVRKPHWEGAVDTVQCGAVPLDVPIEDETWDEWSDFQAAFDLPTGVPGFAVAGAAESGGWHGVENRTAAMLGELMTPFNEALVLVPWAEERKRADVGLEDFVFRGIGQHRVERVKAGDAHKGSAMYAVYLGAMEALEVREGFEQLGGDAYFTEQGRASHIRYRGTTYYPSHRRGAAAYQTETLGREECGRAGGEWRHFLFFGKCHVSEATCREGLEGVRYTWAFFPANLWGNCHVPRARDWQHVKTVFLGSLSAAVTLEDHLYDVHLSHASQVVHAGMETLNKDHPVRRFTTPHSFHTNAINYKAAYSLVEEEQLIHRATALTMKGMEAAFAARRQNEHRIWDSAPERFARQQVTTLPLPLHEDGMDYYDIVRRYVRRSLGSVYDYAANACAADGELQAWFAHIKAKGDASSNFPDALTCEAVEKVLTIFIFSGTAMHTHTGSIVAETVDPCHAPWAVPKGLRTPDGKHSCGAPRTAFMQLVTMMFTSHPMPELLDDYTHLFELQGQQDAWGQFQADLKALQQRVEARNAGRVRPFRSFEPELMDAGVGI